LGVISDNQFLYYIPFILIHHFNPLILCYINIPEQYILDKFYKKTILKDFSLNGLKYVHKNYSFIESKILNKILKDDFNSKNRILI